MQLYRISVLITIVLSLITFPLIGQNEISDEKKVEIMKDMFSRNPASMLQYFERDSLEKYYGMGSVTRTDWEKKYSELDLQELSKEIESNLKVSIKRKSKLILNLESTFSSTNQSEFVKIEFTPLEVILNNQEYSLDSLRTFEIVSVFSTGQNSKISSSIYFNTADTIKTGQSCTLKGELNIQLVESYEMHKLVEGQKIELKNNVLELLEINVGRAFLKGKSNKGSSDYQLMCQDNEGMKDCGMVFSVPEKLYNFLKLNKDDFVKEEYLEVLNSLSISDLDEGYWIRIIDSREFLEHLWIGEQSTTVHENSIPFEVIVDLSSE